MTRHHEVFHRVAVPGTSLVSARNAANASAFNAGYSALVGVGLGSTLILRIRFVFRIVGSQRLPCFRLRTLLLSVTECSPFAAACWSRGRRQTRCAMAIRGSHLRDFTHSMDYGSVATEFRAAGTTGVTMVHCEQPAGHYRSPAAEEFVFSLVFEGSKVKVDHGVRWEAETTPANGLILAPRRTDLSFDLIESVRYVAAFLPYSLMRSALSREGGPAWSGDFGRLHTSFFLDPTISALMLRIWQETFAGTMESALVADTAWTSVAALLLRTSGQSSPSSVHGGLAGWQLRRITEHIQDRLAEDVSP